MKKKEGYDIKKRTEISSLYKDANGCGLQKRSIAMTIEEMRQCKREQGYSYKKIAEMSGLPVGTVQKVLSGITRSPREETLRALENVLKPVVWDDDTVEKNDRSKVYSLYRTEWIDGTAYPLEVPSLIHQILIGEILSQIHCQMKRKRLEGMAIVAPVKVCLRVGEDTLVQPDLVVICDRMKFQRDMICGAPDWIVEVLSAETRRKDMTIKLAKYTAAGVREYWMVDSDKEKILVYLLEKEELPVIYGFQDEIPVGIFDGNVIVDLKKADDIWEVCK